MGHEFVEMKNTGAAIEAYRRGVDVNCRDYRAWYGLGQTYELLAMYFYALFYYRKVRGSCAFCSFFRRARGGEWGGVERETKGSPP